MDIIEYALQMEKDGKAFYERSAAATKQEEIKQILQYLAEEEDRHYNFFMRLKEGNVSSAEAELDAGKSSLATTKNVFVQLTANNKEESFGDDTRTVWKEALAIEKAAVKLYSEHADNENNADRKALLTRIAEEERNHVYLIDNMLTYMADPETFVDSKKFADFKSWEGR
jgi:rubrerythrin